MIGQLLLVVVIHHGIGKLWPAVDQIPPNNAAPFPLIHTEQFNKKFHSLCLRYLTGEGKIFYILGNKAKQLPNLICHQLNAVCPGALLGGIGAVNDPIFILLPRPHLFLGDKLVDRCRFRATVIAHFAGKVGNVFAVIRTLKIISRSPQMLLREHTGILPKAFAVNKRGAGQVRSCRILIPNHRRQHLPCENIVIGISAESDTVRKLVYLIIAGPQQNAGVLTQSSHHRRRFCKKHLAHPIILRIQPTGHHKVLPDQNAVLIAEIIQIIIFVNIAAPQPNGVTANILQQLTGFGQTLPISGVERIHRHKICT